MQSVLWGFEAGTVRSESNRGWNGFILSAGSYSGGSFLVKAVIWSSNGSMRSMRPSSANDNEINWNRIVKTNVIMKQILFIISLLWFEFKKQKAQPKNDRAIRKWSNIPRAHPRVTTPPVFQNVNTCFCLPPPFVVVGVLFQWSLYLCKQIEFNCRLIALKISKYERGGGYKYF